MTEPVWGLFEYDRNREFLRNVFSGQAIELGDERPDQCRFTYRDAETQLTFIVQREPWGWSVDFNDMPAVKQSYGLWRRLAFGLPDSLTFWFSGGRSVFEVGRPHQVTLEGGWQNGRWASSSRITADIGGPPHDPNSPLNPAPPKNVFKLFPLDGRPATWRYVEAADIAQEAKIATVPGRDPPLLDRTQELDVQLARAPRFVRDDGRAVLFHRYVAVSFHRGEDYDPQPHYGYANQHVAFTFNAHGSYGVWHYSNPILVSGWALPGALFDDVNVLQNVTRVTPALGLREELFFALFDICAVRQEIAIGKGLPILRERDREELEYYRGKFPNEDRYWNGIRFAQYLDRIDGLPMRSPLSMGKTSFATVLPTLPGSVPQRRRPWTVSNWLRELRAGRG